MKSKQIVLIFVFLLCCWSAVVWWRQNNCTSTRSNASIASLEAASQTNLEVIPVDVLKPCPPELTNVLSNTNLFSPQEQSLVQATRLKYRDFKIESGLPGAVRTDTNWWARLQSKMATSPTACFQYTNSGDTVKVSGGRIHIRNQAGDGYDISYDPYFDGFAFRQYKHNILDGLYISLEGDHCDGWLRFSNGLAIDKWLQWNTGTPAFENSLIRHVVFKTPYDIQENSIKAPIAR